jgi:DNA modification methylase
MYIGHMVLISREVERVLDPKGVFWCNIGDSYNGSGGAGGDYNPGGVRHGQPGYKGRNLCALQAGDLIMAPARLALALQAEGWIIRKDVIWYKRGPMPEPCAGNRWEKAACNCVKEQREAHITKQMAEQGVERHRIYEKAGTKFKPLPDCPKCQGTGRFGEHKKRFDSWRHTSSHEYVWMLTRQMGYFGDQERAREAPIGSKRGRNPRSVVAPAGSNYSGKHFAVYPPALIAPLIQAATPKMRCPECKAPWLPVIEHPNDPDEKPWVDSYRPSCDCVIVEDGDFSTIAHEPGIVLDPFMGSGTTGMVAKEFGVRYIGCDISFEYLDEQAKLRTKSGTPSKALDDLPLFRGIEA